MILCDLDNTLTPAHSKTPVAASFDFVKACLELDFKFYIISNNHPERVQIVADELKVKYHPSTKKPFGKRLLRFLKEEQLDISRCVIIGDQLLTDVWYANRLTLKSLLSEPCSDKDLPITYINRHLDKILRRKLAKKSKLQPLEGGD